MNYKRLVTLLLDRATLEQLKTIYYMIVGYLGNS